MDSFWFVACVRAECRQVFFPCRRCDRGERYRSLRCAHDTRRAHHLRGRDRLQTCPQAAAFLEALALRSEPLAPQITALYACSISTGPTRWAATLDLPFCCLPSCPA